MDRTRERDDDIAAPIVPEERVKAAKQVACKRQHLCTGVFRFQAHMKCSDQGLVQITDNYSVLESLTTNQK